jgi:hypothetical protein
LNLIEQPYNTPAGYVDSPFMYVYDATALTDGATYNQVTKQLQGGSEFILRRIIGVPTVVGPASAGGRFNYKNASGSYAAGNAASGICFNNVWPVVPEKKYAQNRQITFDLYGVTRAFTACDGTPIYNSFIAFQGVKRTNTNQGFPKNVTAYKYRPLKYSYSYTLTINWAHFTAGGAVQAGQQFSQLLDVYDFELLKISIAQPGAVAALTTNDFQITLYDQNSHQLSDGPVNQGFINSARRSPRLGPPYAGIMPVPPLVYPGGSQIKFDILSMLCSTQVPQVYNITFDGLWRVPC